jgi:hypothetical protein
MSVQKYYRPQIGPSFKTVAPGQASLGQVGIITNYDVVVSLAAVQIQGMFAAPITIIPAPGTGKAVIVDEIVAEILTTSTQFASGGVVHFFYHGFSTEIMAQTIAAATVNAAAGTTVLQLEPAQTAGGTVITPAVGVDITNATGAFTTGTGTMKLFIRYRVVSL